MYNFKFFHAITDLKMEKNRRRHPKKPKSKVLFKFKGDEIVFDDEATRAALAVGGHVAQVA